MKALILALLLSLSGCAVCDHHPDACVAALAVVGASVALSGNHTSHAEPVLVRVPHVH